MKIVGLLAAKNEENYLPIYLKNVLPIVDELIVIDDQSTDNSKQILLSASDKIKVHSNEELIKSGWSEYNIRTRLLELGREAKGTHFVCLDADETFTNNFVPISKKIISKLEPGQKIVMQWIALWKSTTHYRLDNSVWSNNYKDFIVCDDQKIGHDYAFLGVGRTPGINNDDTWLKLNTKYGAVLHYQFSNWRNFQLKQCWYRMSELIKMGSGNEGSINQKYSITLDDPNTFVQACPNDWVAGIPADNIGDLPMSWHINKIQEWFVEYGPGYFDKLNIWHVREINNLK